jgi:hypothetical protein
MQNSTNLQFEQICILYLSVKDIWRDVALDEVVGTPFDSVQEVVCLSGFGVALRENDATHGKDSHSIGHREPKFDKVTSWKVIRCH